MFEDFESVFALFFLTYLDCAIEDSLCLDLFTIEHEAVDEPLYEFGSVNGVGGDDSFGCATFPGHKFVLLSCWLWPLGAVLAPALLAVGGACGLLCASDDVVPNAREVFDSSSPDKDDAVLLEVVSDAWDVGSDLDAVSEPYAGDLSEC